MGNNWKYGYLYEYRISVNLGWVFSLSHFFSYILMHIHPHTHAHSRKEISELDRLHFLKGCPNFRHGLLVSTDINFILKSSFFFQSWHLTNFGIINNIKSRHGIFLEQKYKEINVSSLSLDQSQYNYLLYWRRLREWTDWMHFWEQLEPRYCLIAKPRHAQNDPSVTRLQNKTLRNRLGSLPESPVTIKF